MRKLVLTWLLIASFPVLGASVIQCKDKHGKMIFTDNATVCASGATQKDIRQSNTMESGGHAGSKVNFRVPQRAYAKLDAGWEIYYEKEMEAGAPDLFKKSTQKLLFSLAQIEKQLPAPAVQQLKSLKLYLLWGTDSPLGGNASGMRYVRRGEPDNYPHYDPRWEHSVIVYSATNLVYLSELWTKKALVHEFAHAWHISNWPDKYAEIYAPWENAKQLGLYKNVNDTDGKIIASAYAGKNHLEYFAELSAIYFVGGNYYPFNRDDLGKYDPQGFSMVKKLWGGE